VKNNNRKPQRGMWQRFMKEHDQWKALAELDGCYKEEGGCIALYKQDGTLVCSSCYDVFRFSDHLHRHPRYLTSYDAIIPLIQKLKLKNVRWFDLQRCTPSQLCETVLRETNKWKDEE